MTALIDPFLLTESADGLYRLLYALQFPESIEEWEPEQRDPREARLEAINEALHDPFVSKDEALELLSEMADIQIELERK